jgi:hypothetical protein
LLGGFAVFKLFGFYPVFAPSYIFALVQDFPPIVASEWWLVVSKKPETSYKLFFIAFVISKAIKSFQCKMTRVIIA